MDAKKEKEKIYRGERDKNGHCIVTVNEKPLPLRDDLFNYSSEFDWGCDNRGSAQLALALLSDLLGDDNKAIELHQNFKTAFIISIPKNKKKWLIKEKWLKKIVQEINI